MNAPLNLRLLTANVLLTPDAFDQTLTSLQDLSRIDRQLYLARLRREAAARALRDPLERARLQPLLEKLDRCAL